MAAEFGDLSVNYLQQGQIHFATYVLELADLSRLQYDVSRYPNSRLQPPSSVSIGSGLPGCGPGLEPDRMVGSGLLPRLQGYAARSGTGSNWTVVRSYGSYNFDSK